jgi:Ca2+-binding RTX toxin-like protein
MPTPTAFEQELLELTNRARLDPQGEYQVALDAIAADASIASAISYFDVNLDAFRDDIAGFSAAAPLAWNTNLADAALTHSNLMIAQDAQSHQLPGEAGLGDRITDAGYTGWSTVGENIFAYSRSALYAHVGFFVDWGTGPNGMQDPAGHRISILNERYTEIGIAAPFEDDASTTVGPYVVTQDFGNRYAYDAQLLGVVIDDQDGDAFYDIGEGLGGILVEVRNTSGAVVASTTTWDSGGYQVELAAGSYTVTFSGSGLTGSIVQEINMGNENLKLDGLAADAVVAAPAENMIVEGDTGDNILAGDTGNDQLSGEAGNDTFTPNHGNDTIDGGAGVDAVTFIDHAAGVIVDLNAGTANSGSDRNVLIDIENVTGSVHGDFIQTDDAVNRVRASGGYDWLVGSEGADYFDGGTGRDMISYVYADTGVTVDLGAGRGTAGQATGDRYVDVERVTGSIHSDLFYGADGEEDFRGLGGYDWFVGSTGGRDRYDGGTGRDTVAYSASTAAVNASLQLGYGSGGDALRDLYTSIENLTGSSHDDILIGDSGRNVLRGLYGEDHLSGGAGVDRLLGGASDDYIDGGTGWDVAMFEGDRDEYTITFGTAGVIVEHDGRDGTDTIFNVEALQFADDMIFL